MAAGALVMVGNILSSIIGSSRGGPAIGFFVDLGIDTLKRLRPRRNRISGRARGGYEALDQGGASGSTINILDKGDQIPAVIGTHRVSMQAAGPPWTVMAGGGNIDTYQIFALQGEHDLSEIYVNDTPAGSFPSGALQTETRTGSDSDTALTLATRCHFEEILEEELPRFEIISSSTRLLVDQTTPTNSAPEEVVHTTKGNAKEIWVRFLLPNGLIRSGNISSTGIRMRMRPKGSSTWRNIPEFRLRGNYSERKWLEVRFIFGPDPGGGRPINFNNYTFPALMWNRIYASFATIYSFQYDADPYFGPYESNQGGSLTQHYDAGSDVCTFWLDPNDPSNPWPISETGYEIAIKRGYGGGQLRTFNGSFYFDIDGSPGSWAIGDNGQRTLPESSDIIWHSLTTVRDEYPGPAIDKNYALLAVKARNIRLTSVSALAKGRTRIYSGGNWDTIAETDNPAAWARRIFIDKYAAYPMPDSVRSDADFQAWYDYCAAQGLKVHMVVEGGMTIDRLFALLCDAGYAKPRNGATRGVWIDQNKSSDEIEGIITAVNAQGLTIAKPYDEVPQAYTVSFYDETKDYAKGEERTLYRNGYSALTPHLKSQALAAPGKTIAAEVDQWALRRLNQAQERPMRFQVRMDWEFLKFNVGSLVGLAMDTLDTKYSAAVVKSVQTNAGNVTGLTLYSGLSLPLAFENNMWERPNWWSPSNHWTQTAIRVGIQYLDNEIVYKSVNENTVTDTLTFETPFATNADLAEGCVIWVGPSGSEPRRVLVEEITPAEDLTALITLTDEAPSIHP